MFYSKAPPTFDPGGDTVKRDIGFITYFMTTKSAGLIKHSRVLSLRLFLAMDAHVCTLPITSVQLSGTYQHVSEDIPTHATV